MCNSGDILRTARKVTHPELMNALLSLLVVNERKQCGEGMKKVAGLNFASREANISNLQQKYESPLLSKRNRPGHSVPPSKAVLPSTDLQESQ
jgi:hypothetical protein